MAETGGGGVAYDATHEVRFAVVLYGGVSLAIYINGVVRELLNLVWATAPGASGGLRWPDSPSRVVDVYRELGRRLVDGELRYDTAGPVRTRFVVDIIAGASAGGINGVCLAKALACDLDLNELDELWIREADIAELINDRRSQIPTVTNERPPQALLNGPRMQYVLLKALQAMNHRGSVSGHPDQGHGEGSHGGSVSASDPNRESTQVTALTSPYADAIDLFVTATDLAGRGEQLMLSDQPAGPVGEVVHRTVFRFMYGHPDAIGGDKAINQFSAAYDPMLAFAARTTASFPGAFAPTCLNDLHSVLGEVDPTGLGTVEGTEGDVRRYFFGRYGDDYKEVYFADGGYLDNKPFEPTLDVLPHRRANLTVDRKLLYVEPDPSVPRHGRAPADEDRAPSIVDAIIKAASLPRVETIGRDINRIRSFGQLAAGRRAVYDQIRAALDRTLDAVGDVPATPPGGAVVNMAIVDRAQAARIGTTAEPGPGSAPAGAAGLEADPDTAEEGQLGASALPDVDLNAPTTGGTDPQTSRGELTTAPLSPHALLAPASDIARPAPTTTAYLELRVTRTLHDIGEALARIVGEQVYDSGSVVHIALAEAARVWRDKEDVTAELMLARYDLRFALDRINFVQGRVRDRDDTTPGDRDDDRSVLQDLDKAYAELRGRGRAIRMPSPDHPARAEIDQLRTVLDVGTSDRSVAEILRNDAHARDAFGNLLTGLADHLKLEAASAEHQNLLLKHPNHDRLLRYWSRFSAYDEAAGPLRDELPGENDSIEIHRLSPYDTQAIVPDPVKNPKLAGTAIHHFGGFFHEDWRRNDILWGRLDTAERIITTLVPDTHAADRKDLIDRAQLAILDELLDDDDWRSWLRDRFRTLDGAPEESRANELRSALKARPRPDSKPDPASSLDLGARAARVASQVIDHLADGPHALPGARMAGRALRLTANVVELLLPGLKSLVWERVLVLVMVAAALTAVGGLVLGLDQVRTFGIVTLVVAVSLRVVSDIAVARIERRRPKLAWVARTAVGILLVLTLLGVNAVAHRGDGWQYTLLGFVPAVLVLTVLCVVAWRSAGDTSGVSPSWRWVGWLVILLLAGAAVSFATVAVADWDATWESFKNLISTS